MQVCATDPPPTLAGVPGLWSSESRSNKLIYSTTVTTVVAIPLSDSASKTDDIFRCKKHTILVGNYIFVGCWWIRFHTRLWESVVDHISFPYGVRDVTN